MFKRVNVSFLIALSFGFLTGLDHASAQLDDSLRLGHFQKVKTITLSDPDGKLSDELLIAEIKSLDVDPGGRLLIVDLSGGQAFLFDPDGNLIASLDPSLCHPGFEVRPVTAVFVGDQSIFLANAGPWGYRFTFEGECLGNVHSDYALTTWGYLDSDEQGNLVGYYRRPTPSVRFMTSEGQTIREIELPSSKFPNVRRRVAMGGIVVDRTHVFVAEAVEREILKIALDGTIESRISHRTSWFQDITRDLPDFNSENPTEFMRASGELYGSATLPSEIFELTYRIIMVQYRGPKGLGYQLFTKDGLFVAEQLGVNYYFKQGKNGLVYRVVQPEPNDTGLPNAFIEVYQFVEP